MLCESHMLGGDMIEIAGDFDRGRFFVHQHDVDAIGVGVVLVDGLCFAKNPDGVPVAEQDLMAVVILLCGCKRTQSEARRRMRWPMATPCPFGVRRITFRSSQPAPPRRLAPAATMTIPV